MVLSSLLMTTSLLADDFIDIDCEEPLVRIGAVEDQIKRDENWGAISDPLLAIAAPFMSRFDLASISAVNKNCRKILFTPLAFKIAGTKELILRRGLKVDLPLP